MADAFFSTRGAGAFSSSRNSGRTPGRDSGVLLFDEDFDQPPPSVPPPDPEIIQPLFTLAELTAAREEAALTGRDAAFAEAAATTIATTGRALTTIAEQIQAARTELASIADAASEAITRLLLGCFATAFPALSARHGSAEAAAVLRQILPTLHREPKVTVRVNPHIADAMTREIEALDADLAAHIRLLPTDAILAGDARITWEYGAATRDAVSLWKQIESILAPAGLLNTASPSHAEHTVKEHALVE